MRPRHGCMRLVMGVKAHHRGSQCWSHGSGRLSCGLRSCGRSLGWEPGWDQKGRDAGALVSLVWTVEQFSKLANLG